MTNRALKEAVERAQRWPEARQEVAARILRDMDAQGEALHQLTAEQAAEVEHRLANVDPKVMTLAEARARLNHRGT